MKILFLEKKEKIIRLLGEDILLNLNVDFYGEKLFVFNKIKLKKYDVIINFNYSNRFHNSIIKEARRLGLFTILLHDGIFEWNNTYLNNVIPLYSRLYHDVFLACGNYSQIKNININNLNRSNKIIKYVPYYLKKTNYIKRLKLSKYNFLITTSNNCYFNKDERDTLVKTINNIVKQLISCNLSFSFRIYDDFLKENIHNFHLYDNLIKDNLNNVINLVDGVISTRSSLMVEVIQCQLPVCEILYRDTPDSYIAGWKVFLGLNMASTFYSMLEKSPERMNYQMQYLRDFQCIPKFDNYDIDSLLIGKSVSVERLKSLLKLLTRS